jgi:hypothetical protein
MILPSDAVTVTVRVRVDSSIISAHAACPDSVGTCRRRRAPRTAPSDGVGARESSMRLLLLAVFLVSCEAMQHNGAIQVLPRYILRIQPKVTSWIAWTRMDCVVDFYDFEFKLCLGPWSGWFASSFSYHSSIALV